MTDFFVICTADVDQQIRAVVKNIEEKVKTETGDRVIHREGFEGMNWVLLDYVDVVVHVFKPSFREYYRLEDLWSDADVISVSEAVTAKPTVIRKRKVVSTEERSPRAAKARSKSVSKVRSSETGKRAAKPSTAATKPTPRAKHATRKPRAKAPGSKTG